MRPEIAREDTACSIANVRSRLELEKAMWRLKCWVLVVLCAIASNVGSARDVNLSMFMYLANHLTPQECLKLAAHLYAGGLEDTAVKELEQDLPSDEPCLSLLMTWNISAGKEKSFLTISDCLRKIDNEKLAEWLSDTVFTQLSMELKNDFLENTTKIYTPTAPSPRPLQINRPILKIESCWSDKSLVFLLLDTFCMYLILMATVTLVFYSLSMLVHVFIESQNILTARKREYKILELGVLPRDLDDKDEILDPFF